MGGAGKGAVGVEGVEAGLGVVRKGNRKWWALTLGISISK